MFAFVQQLALTNKNESCIMLAEINKNKREKNDIKIARRIFENNVCITKTKWQY